MPSSVHSKNEMKRRTGENSVSLHMYHFLVVCHVCSHFCTLIDSRTEINGTACLCRPCVHVFALS